MSSALALRVLEHQAEVLKRFWRAPLFIYLVFPILFLAAIGLGVGELVSRRTGQVGGLSYLDFVAPGLMAASAMQGGAGASLWPVMGGIKWMGTYQAMVATPVGPADVYDGVVVATTTRASIGAAAFVLIATVLGAVSSPWAIAAVPAAGLCAAAFAAPLTAFTATQENDAQFPVIMRIVVMPLFLFSGTFFPVGQLPVGLRIAARFSPLWHGVELCRAATTGTLRLAATAVHISVLVACILAGAVWGHRTFTRRLTP